MVCAGLVSQMKIAERRSVNFCGMAANLWEEAFVKNRLFTLTVLLMAGMLCLNTGCRRKKGGLAGGDAGGADSIGGVGGAVDLSAEGWDAGRPENMELISGLQFENVQFEYDSTQISGSERGKIEGVAEYCAPTPRSASSRKDIATSAATWNTIWPWSERRALAVRAYLIGLGIDGGIIQTKSYGEEKPLAPGNDEASWAQNRRVEFVFYNY